MLSARVQYFSGEGTHSRLNYSIEKWHISGHTPRTLLNPCLDLLIS